MGWVRLDDGFPRHPKVVGLSSEEFRAYVEGLCYAAEFETDGFIPDSVAANGPIRETLVRVGLWETGEAGVVAHDFLMYNPSREQKESTRQSKRLAGAIGAATRYGDSKGVGVGGLLAVREKESFELFWGIVPRKVGKRTAEAAFRRALKRAPVTDILAGAERLRDDPNLPEPRYIPHPTTWLNRDGWLDDPLPPRSGGGPKTDRLARGIEAARRKKADGYR